MRFPPVPRRRVPCIFPVCPSHGTAVYTYPMVSPVASPHHPCQPLGGAYVAGIYAQGVRPCIYCCYGKPVVKCLQPGYRDAFISLRQEAALRRYCHLTVAAFLSNSSICSLRPQHPLFLYWSWTDGDGAPAHRGISTRIFFLCFSM